MQISEILAVAQAARHDFESRRLIAHDLKPLYLAHNPYVEFYSFFKEAEKIFPKLNCGLASVYLKSKIPDAKIVRGKYQNNPHTFLMVENLVVDITADQYGGPKVYVGPLKHPWTL